MESGDYFDSISKFFIEIQEHLDKNDLFVFTGLE